MFAVLVSMDCSAGRGAAWELTAIGSTSAISARAIPRIRTPSVSDEQMTDERRVRRMDAEDSVGRLATKRKAPENLRGLSMYPLRLQPQRLRREASVSDRVQRAVVPAAQP